MRPKELSGSQDIRRLLKALWLKSCRHDEISPDAKFVAFSAENPYQERYNRIVGLYMAGMRK